MKRNRLLAYSALAVVCVVWGTTYLGIKVGVTHFPPLLFSIARLVLSGLLVLIVLPRQIRWKELTPSAILHQSIAGLIMFGLGNGLVSVSMSFTGISSGLASIIGSLIPVWVILFNRLFNPSERITPGILIGTLIGLGGVILIFEDRIGTAESSSITGAMTMAVAGLAFAGGSVWIKAKKLAMDPFGTTAIQMLTGGLFLIPVSLWLEDWTTVTIDAEAIWVVAYLVLFGSLLGYFCYLYAIRRLPVSLVSVYAYINPVVAVLLGWLILSEPLGFRIVAGMLITLLGVYLVNTGINFSYFRRSSPTEDGSDDE